MYFRDVLFDSKRNTFWVSTKWIIVNIQIPRYQYTTQQCNDFYSLFLGDVNGELKLCRRPKKLNIQHEHINQFTLNQTECQHHELLWIKIRVSSTLTFFLHSGEHLHIYDISEFIVLSSRRRCTIGIFIFPGRSNLVVKITSINWHVRESEREFEQVQTLVICYYRHSPVSDSFPLDYFAGCYYCPCHHSGRQYSGRRYYQQPDQQ